MHTSHSIRAIPDETFHTSHDDANRDEPTHEAGGMTERYTETLQEAAEPVWAAQRDHPFITGIGDGSLGVERFEHYVRQDYRFLIEYARLLALGAARAPDLDTMRRLAELAQSTLTTEMDLHRAYARQFSISEDELEAEPMAPTTQAYTDFLVRTATTGDFAELAAALLPCMWGYAELGRWLASRGPSPEPRYAAWVDMYAGDEFGELADWCRGLVDRLAEGMPGPARARVAQAFLTSSRYELAFWQMAWDREGWPT
jgi:thiaminase/transcriptional activator TenA